MRKVSLYLKSKEISPSSYYRLTQYFDRDNGDVSIKWHTSLTDKQFQKFIPIGNKSIVIKIYVMILMYFRRMSSLLADLYDTPDIIIISRSIINRWMPFSFVLLLKIIKSKGSRIIWDFDDNIIECKETPFMSFQFLSKLSDSIVVTHEYLKKMISLEYRDKVHILPTTDGDMYSRFSSKIIDYRSNEYDRKINLVWVATATYIPILEDIIPFIDDAAKKIHESSGKQVLLTVICNRQLNVIADFLKIRNVVWTREVAINELLKGHIGLMPLRDTEFAKGKGGFKLIQYMSIGLPIVASAVGYNVEIVNSNGFLIKKLSDWTDYIVLLSTDKTLWKQMSDESFKIWEKDYNYSDNFTFWRNQIGQTR